MSGYKHIVNITIYTLLVYLINSLPQILLAPRDGSLSFSIGVKLVGIYIAHCSH